MRSLGWTDGDKPATRGCDHVKMIRVDEMKATNLDTGEHGERFLTYMYETGSNDSGTDTAE